MLSSVLIVSSARAHNDASEILRMQDTIACLLSEGYAVDVLVPRTSSLLTAALPQNARIFTTPCLPMCGDLPKRASFRRFMILILMFLRCVSLVSRRSYKVLHGFNDGSVVARIADRVTVRKYRYIAEMHSPMTRKRFFKGPRSFIARILEGGALKHASAVILSDKEVMSTFKGKIPVARVSIIPDPHVDFVPDAFTYGEFREAVRHVYDYVLRPGNE